jgi:type IV fimbrial biogenesis protein FimT
MLKMRSSAGESGFTLIELMIGVGIMALVLGLAMPSYKSWIQNTQIRNAAESLLYGLQMARSEAVTRNVDINFTLGTSGSKWTVGCQTAVVDVCPAVIYSHATGDGSSKSVTVSSASGTAVVFNNLGGMKSPTPVAPLTKISMNVDVDPAVLSAAESRDLRVTVDIGGNVRMCDPNVSVTTDVRYCPP